MQIGVIRNEREILLNGAEAAALVLIVVLAVVLAFGVGHFIGLGAGKVINAIVDHAETHQEDCGCDEEKRNFVPIEVPRDGNTEE